MILFGLLTAVLSFQSNGRIGSVSELTPMPSVLSSLCYLCQGYPDTVVGASFSYTDPRAKLFESYLSSLINSPNQSQRYISQCSIFLSNRLYLDMNGHSHLVMSASDANYHLTILKFASNQGIGPNDARLADLLKIYFLLPVDVKQAKENWRKEKLKFQGKFRDNVELVLADISSTNQIGDNWVFPRLFR